MQGTNKLSCSNLPTVNVPVLELGAPAKEVSYQFKNSAFPFLPVTWQGIFVGVLHRRDWRRWPFGKWTGRLCKDTVFVFEDDAVSEVLPILETGLLSYLTVLNRSHQVVGLTKHSLVQAAAAANTAGKSLAAA